MNLKKSIKVAVLTLVLVVLLGMVGTLTEGPRTIGYAHFWDVFSAEASVTPVINGTISAGEWDAAHMEAFTSLGFYTHDENAATCYADSGETDGFDLHLRGRVDKGPFIIGSLVSVSLINDSGHPTGEVFNTHTINNQGQFELELPLPRYTSWRPTGSTTTR